MTENEVMECLYNDICGLKLPPISEKVFQALDEKRKQNMEMNKELAQVKKLHKGIPTKYVFAAMLAIIAVSVPIIIVLTNKAPISDLPDSPVLPSSSETVSISESAVFEFFLKSGRKRNCIGAYKVNTDLWRGRTIRQE